MLYNTFKQCIIQHNKAQQGIYAMSNGFKVPEAAIKAKQEETILKNKARAAELAGEPVQLTLGTWFKKQRAIPKPISNSAIFRVLAKGEQRLILRNEKVASRTKGGVAEFEVFFTGEELDQRDMDLWLECCHEVHMNDNNCSSIQLTQTEMLKRLKRSKSGVAVKQLKASLLRLQGAQIVVEGNDESGKKYTYISSLVLRALVNKDGINVQLDSELSGLFSRSVAYVDHELRLSLGSDLAKAMFAFVTSDRPEEYRSGSFHRVKVNELHGIVGSRATTPNFKKSLRIAMNLLITKGVINYWAFIGNGSTAIEYTLTSSAGRKPAKWHITPDNKRCFQD